MSKLDKLRSFATLGWYDECIKFIFNFVAKTSEVLLAAGLIVSTANFLTDGAIMAGHPVVATSWAWCQAVAIDSSLGVTFYYVFGCIKHRDWVKVILYSLLTILLAVVAGTITNVDTFSHAQHLTIAAATAEVGIPVWVLTLLRAIAVVGFILMSRLKDVSFTELYKAPSQGVHPPDLVATFEEKLNTLAEAEAQAREAMLVVMKREVLNTVTVSMEEQKQLLLTTGEHPRVEPSERPRVNKKQTGKITRIGLVRSATEDKRERVRRVLTNNPGASISEIERQANVSRGYASKLRSELLSENGVRRASE